jgi:uncharacterized membrane protein YhaH (DUF805 family)
MPILLDSAQSRARRAQATGESMNNLLQNFMGFEGRLNRQPFWISGVILAVIGIVISFLILPIVGLSMMPNISAGTSAADVAATLPDMMRRSGWISLVMFLIFLYPAAALCIKRRHDRNNSGLDVWIYFALGAINLLVNALGIGMSTMTVGDVTLPTPGPISIVLGAIVGIYAIYLLVVLGFLKGTAGPNSYGPDPLQG